VKAARGKRAKFPSSRWNKFSTVKKILAIILTSLTFIKIISAQEISITPTNRIELFNGQDFSGFTFCMKDDADPMQTWSVTNDAIHCTGKPTGYIRTKKSFQNYILTVEWRFVKVAPHADNTGVLVDMQLPDKVWPMCVQNQGKSGRQGDFFVMGGAECKEHLALGKDANTPVPMHDKSNEHPIGEWDTNRTVCAGNDLKAYVNGKFMNEISECTVTNGFVGIQSEGAEIEIRKMYLEPLEQTEFFKTITDAQIGEYAVVNSDKTIVTLKDKNGNVIWSANIVKESKTFSWLLGERKINEMYLFKNQLVVGFGRAALGLDKQTGKITSFGQN
jgi:hypothetical protein